MSSVRRICLCAVLLALGLAAQAGLEAMTEAPRPLLKRSLATIPTRLGTWVGHDVEIDPKVRAEAQGDDLLNRSYEDERQGGRRVSLWINYSKYGLNLRHSPAVCLPSGGWSKVDSLCGVREVPTPAGKPLSIYRLGYAQGERLETIGFWYYIFGEGTLERWVRGLPITSRSSHGRATRGSGLTVEVFCPEGTDDAGDALEDFARALVPELESLLPESRVSYYLP